MQFMTLLLQTVNSKVFCNLEKHFVEKNACRTNSSAISFFITEIQLRGINTSISEIVSK